MQKVMYSFFPILIIGALLAGCSQPSSNPQTSQETQQKALGFIEGSMGYPSEGIPLDIKVCADNLDNQQTYCTNERLEGEQYKYHVGYKLEVPEGSYYVYEMHTAFDYHSYPAGYKAYFSEYVVCGESCTDHTPIKVPVTAGETTPGIDPTDWAHT